MAAKKQGRRTAEQAKITKIKIMTTATILFCDHGYQQVSLRDISEKAGVSHSLIRHYFGAKHQIWEEILYASHNYMTRYMIELQKVTHHDSDSNISLYRFTVCLMAFVMKRPRLFQLIFACTQMTDPVKMQSEEEQQRNHDHLDLIFNAYEIYQDEDLTYSQEKLAELKWNFLNFASTPILLKPLMLKVLGSDHDHGLLTHWRLYENQMSKELNVDDSDRIRANSINDVVNEFDILDSDVAEFLKEYFAKNGMQC